MFCSVTPDGLLLIIFLNHFLLFISYEMMRWKVEDLFWMLNLKVKRFLVVSVLLHFKNENGIFLQLKPKSCRHFYFCCYSWTFTQNFMEFTYLFSLNREHNCNFLWRCWEDHVKDLHSFWNTTWERPHAQLISALTRVLWVVLRWF